MSKCKKSAEEQAEHKGGEKDKKEEEEKERGTAVDGHCRHIDEGAIRDRIIASRVGRVRSQSCQQINIVICEVTRVRGLCAYWRAPHLSRV